MQYKTIVLELLQQRTELHDQLRRERRFLPAMEQFARELKASHQAWKEQLSTLSPDSDPSQITSEALEMAIRELEDRLPPDSPQENNEPLSLDGAMAFIRRHTSHGLKRRGDSRHSSILCRTNRPPTKHRQRSIHQNRR